MRKTLMVANINDHNCFDFDMYAFPVKDIVKKGNQRKSQIFILKHGPSETNPPTDRIETLWF